VFYWSEGEERGAEEQLSSIEPLILNQHYTRYNVYWTCVRTKERSVEAKIARIPLSRRTKKTWLSNWSIPIERD